MKRLPLLPLVLLLAAVLGLLAACTATEREEPAAGDPTKPVITVFRPPT